MGKESLPKYYCPFVCRLKAEEKNNLESETQLLDKPRLQTLRIQVGPFLSVGRLESWTRDQVSSRVLLTSPSSDPNPPFRGIHSSQDSDPLFSEFKRDERERKEDEWKGEKGERLLHRTPGQDPVRD